MKTLQENLDIVEVLRMAQYECSEEIYGEGDFGMVNREELCKQINGKVLKWLHVTEGKPDLLFDVILLAQVEKGSVSVKPYGYTPKKLYKMFSEIGYRYPLEFYKDPKFCLAAFDMTEQNLVKLASLEESEIGSFDYVCGGIDYLNLVNPVCPY